MSGLSRLAELKSAAPVVFSEALGVVVRDSGAWGGARLDVHQEHDLPPLPWGPLKRQRLLEPGHRVRFCVPGPF